MKDAALGEEVFSWGWAEHGQVGHGGEEVCVSTMKSMDRVLLQGQRVRHVACGFCFNLALTTRGSVYSWGMNTRQQLGHADQKHEQVTPRKIKFFHQRNVAMVAAGRDHALAVLATGEVYSWGSGGYGVLGHNNEDECTEPRIVEWFRNHRADSNEFKDAKALMKLQLSSLRPDVAHENSADTGEGDADAAIFIVSVACGHSHNLALDNKGRVYSWGLGLLGRLGHGDEKTRRKPKLVRALADQNIKVRKVCCGWDHSAVLTKRNGNVFTWGCGRSHQLGGVGLRQHETAPNTLFRRTEEDGTMFMSLPIKVMRWQYRGPKNAVLDNVSPPRIVELSCGGKHNLAVDQDGNVYTWGRGEFGRLGHQDQRHQVFPLRVAGFEEPIAAVSGGGYHSMAVSKSGVVYVWGYNEHGRLGVAASQLFLTKPTVIPQTSLRLKHRNSISNVFAGAYMSMAVGTFEDNDKANGSCTLQ